MYRHKRNVRIDTFNVYVWRQESAAMQKQVLLVQVARVHTFGMRWRWEEGERDAVNKEVEMEVGLKIRR